ncbi:MAG: hypothetical protein HY908_03880 [Myxococcales bacterium]|nr:hypothetical protein [Myxococcales bacterium]
MWYFLSNALTKLYQGAGPQPGAPAGSSTHDVVLRVWREVVEPEEMSLADAPEGVVFLLAGSWHGHPCELALVRVKGSIVPRTRVRSSAASAEARLRVAPRSAWRGLAAGVTGQRVRTGDLDFDRAFVVTGAAGARALDAASREVLLFERAREPELRIARGELVLHMEGAELGHESVAALLDACVRIARAADAD